MSTPQLGSYVFESFRFDADTGELTQRGARIRLGKQAADILTILLGNPGTLVTRQQIRTLLWPDGELVDHDKVINNGISRLRFTFKDDPLNPTYIERVPKRGYRWICETTRLARHPAEHAIDLAETVDVAIPVEGPIEPIPTAHTLEQTSILTIGPTVWPEGGPSRADSRRRLSGRARGALVFAALAILAVGLAFNIWHHHPKPGRDTSPPISLAVAPLVASGAGAQELAESFRLDLTDALAQLPQVQVRAAHSVNQLRLTDALAPVYSATLGLDVILFGHFTLEGRDCHVQFEIVRAKDSTHIATLNYSGTIDQLSTLRDRIQNDTFKRLQLAGKSGARPVGSTSDPQAYESYLEARYHFSQQTSESLALAVREYTVATGKDPQFSQAYVGLAQTYLIMLSDGDIPPAEGYGKAEQAVMTAVRLGDSSAQVHSILGFIKFYRDWNLAAGIDEERQAIRLEPNQAIYHQWLAVLLSDEGRYTESLDEVTRAQAADPYWPSLYVTEAFASVSARDYRRAMAASRKLKDLLPDSPLGYDVTANVLWYSGRSVDAISEWRRMAEIEGDSNRIRIEDQGLQAFRTGGVQAYARVRLEALKNTDAAKHKPNDFEASEWYETGGDTAAAANALLAAAQIRAPQFMENVMAPLFSNVLKEASVSSFLRTSGLSVQLGL